MSAENEFRRWFASEQESGLVDVKFAIANSVSEKAVSRVVLHNIVTSERMIEAGIVETHLEGIVGARD